jgi:hypothetical protein
MGKSGNYARENCGVFSKMQCGALRPRGIAAPRACVDIERLAG